jgi:hypothetical protein
LRSSVDPGATPRPEGGVKALSIGNHPLPPGLPLASLILDKLYGPATPRSADEWPVFASRAYFVDSNCPFK